MSRSERPKEGTDAQVSPLRHRNPVDARGFTMLMNCVLYDAALSDGARVTYMVLLDYARQEESCFPGQGTLAERRGVGVRTVRYHLTELEERGLISVEQRGHMKTNIYWIEDIRAVYAPAVSPPVVETPLPAAEPSVSDRQKIAGHEGKIIAGQDRQKIAAKEDVRERRLRDNKTTTFNVSDETVNIEPLRPGGGSPDRRSELIRAKVDAVIAELGDQDSERRHWQLVSICEERNLLGLIDSALEFTRARQRQTGRKGSVEKPGAYYQSVLLKLLEDRQVFVPKVGGTEEGQRVDLEIKKSLGLTG